MTSKDHLQHAVDSITRRSGHVNLLVCNAGKASPVPDGVPTETSTVAEVRKYFFETVKIEDHTEVLNLNTTAVLLTTFAFLELLDAGNKANAAASPPKPKSQIITTASAGAFFRRGGDFIYNASKAATTHAMKQMASFLVPWDIRSNVLAPGCELNALQSKPVNALMVTQGSCLVSRQNSPSNSNHQQGFCPRSTSHNNDSAAKKRWLERFSTWRQEQADI